MQTAQKVTAALKTLHPGRHPDWSWCFVFLPFFFVYFSLLLQLFNSFPSISTSSSSFPSSVDIIASGSEWAEGPLWVEDASCDCSYLLFSDTKKNQISRWETGRGLFTVGKTLFIDESGCNPRDAWCSSTLEPGTNGLCRYIGDSGRPEEVILIACSHGERAVSIIFENGTKGIIASEYNGQRLNSPNDAVMSMDRHLYFTDPPYGLVDKNTARLRDFQQGFSGVYMIHRDDLEEAVRTGKPTTNVKLLDATMTRPNGIAFSPDFSKLYVSNSDFDQPYWKVFDVEDNGSIENGTVFYDGKEFIQNDDLQNVPDGFKVDTNGNIYATGPGGVIIFSPNGTVLDRLFLDRKASNIEISDDGFMYITATDAILRVRTNARPAKALKISL